MNFIGGKSFIGQMKDDGAEFLGRNDVHKLDEGH